MLIHDGVRPFITYEVIANNIEGVEANGNAITCTSCYETILLSKTGDVVDSVSLPQGDLCGTGAPELLS